MNPAEVLHESAKRYTENIVCSVDGREQTYGQMYERATKLANALSARGIAPGDRVATLGDNAFETVEQVAACALGNYVRASLYTYHSAEVNRYLLAHVGAKVLLVQARYYADLEPLVKDLDDLLVIVLGGKSEGAEAYDDFLAGGDARPINVRCSGDDIHIIRFSSGTTGRPKGIYHTVDRWMDFNAEYRWVTPLINEESRYFAVGSIAHFGVALLWQALTVGAQIVSMSTFEPRAALDLMERKRVTHAALVPVMIKEMVDAADDRGRDFSGLQCLLYAGSPIAQATLRKAISLFGSVLYQVYAQSEALLVSVLQPHQHQLTGTKDEVGRLRSAGRATPHTVLTIRDESGAVLPAGEVGEVAAKSPAAMSGIWNDSESYSSRRLPDGSVLTRDMGYLDDDGFLFLVDRKDDMIISGGYNIWPTELEGVLVEHAGVHDVCVIGVPHDKWGETPKALVIRAEGSDVTEEELIDYTRTRVGSVKKITSVEWVTELPRSGAGKLLRSQARKMFLPAGAEWIQG